MNYDSFFLGFCVAILMLLVLAICLVEEDES